MSRDQRYKHAGRVLEGRCLDAMENMFKSTSGEFVDQLHQSQHEHDLFIFGASFNKVWIDEAGKITQEHVDYMNVLKDDD